MKHSLGLFYSLLSFLLLFTLSVSAQPFKLADYVGKVSNVAAQQQRERLHLHLDKPFYAAGDDIWIKSYLVIGAENRLSALSSVLYVDLLDENDVLVQRKIVPVVSGLGITDFALPDTLQAGNYKLRGYTQYMRNFDDYTLFEQVLPIMGLTSNSYIIEQAYDYVQERNKQKLISHIRLRDAVSQQPIANKRVNYRMVLNDQRPQRGNARTDAQGNIYIELAEATKIIQGQLELDLDNGVTKVLPLNHIQPKPSLQFFAEGGNFLAGQENTLGFKAIGPDGLAVIVEGKVFNRAGQLVSTFKSFPTGMGFIQLKPLAGEKYVAEVLFENGHNEKVDLPEVMVSGITVGVNNQEATQLRVSIKVSEDLINSQTVNVVLQQEGQVFYSSTKALNTNENIIYIPKHILPLGIIQVSVLNTEYQPLTERHVFINNETQHLPLALFKLPEKIGSRSLINLEIEAGRAIDTNRFAALSVAVVDLNKLGVEEDHQHWNIFSSLLLSPYLKGYIEKPAQYFDYKNEQRFDQLEALMLTQGWTKLDWSTALIEKSLNEQFMPEKSLAIRGKVTRLNGRTPIADAEVVLMSMDSTQIALTTTTDKNGLFEFDNLLFNDGVQFLLQAKSDRIKNDIMLHLFEESSLPLGTDRTYYQASENTAKLTDTYAQHSAEEFENWVKQGFKTKVNVIEEVRVDVTVARIKEVTKHSSNLNGPGNADYVVTMYELENCINITTCLLGKLPGVMFENGWPYLLNSLFTTGASVGGGGPRMLVVVDGMEFGPEADESPLLSLNPTDIASVELLKHPGTIGVYGSKGFAGVLIVTTKTGDLTVGIKKENNFITKRTSALGFAVARSFYAPIYSINGASMSHLKDLRSTIHWEPNVVTDEKGKASLEFYTADGPGKYLITVEGIDLQGRIGRVTKVIHVDK